MGVYFSYFLAMRKDSYLNDSTRFSTLQIKEYIMTNQLDSLRELTVVVADTGDIDAIRQ